MQGAASVGFFGKLPCAGDFVQRRLPAHFVETWDRSLEHAVDATRALLGEQWLTAYRGSPLWRFVLAPGACTESAWAGVFGPSLDRVGRCFPMVIAAPLGTDTGAMLQLLRSGHGWFDALEQTYIAGQTGDRVAVDVFDAQVAALPGPLDSALAGPWTALHRVDWRLAEHWRLPLPAACADGAWLSDTWLQLANVPGPWCQWWTMAGSERVPPSLLVTRGLPQSSVYAGFLDGQSGLEVWRVPAGLALPQTRCPALSPMAAATSPGNAVAACSSMRDGFADWRLLPEAGSAAASPPLPDDLSDLLTDAGVNLSRAADVTIAGIALATHSATGNRAVACVRRNASGLTLIAADDGTPNAQRQAATRVAGVAEALAVDELQPGLHVLRDRLLAMHQQLASQRDDLINPVMEDAAVIALRIAHRVAEFLRIGAAAAWQSHHGRVRPVFSTAPIPASTAQGDPTGLDEFLGRHEASPATGLGGATTPDCEDARCEVAVGDRLLLVATRSLIEHLSVAVIEQALALPTCDAACVHIASAVRLGNESAQWPFTVTEVES